jgi:hypothetical protein
VNLRSIAIVAAVGIVLVGAWLAWAVLSGGFCNPPPNAACL